MSSRNTLLVGAAMVLVATAALLVPATASKNQTFIVGDDAGWDVGVNYKAWAHGKKFKVGDVLVFRPHNKQQDVVLVDEIGFDACVAAQNAIVLRKGGKAYVGGFATPGQYFFICDAEEACESGMKLAVDVNVH